MDRYGPERIMQVYQPSTGSLGLLVIDNTVLGPGLGGLYFSKDVSVDRASETARLYTLMNSLHEVPFGGACSYIVKGEDWKIDLKEFAASIAPLANSSFIACPGGEIGQQEMELYSYASGDVRGTVGKPASLKGIPFETGAVGLGIAHCALEAAHVMRMDEPKISVHGIGRDGLFAARILSRNGAKVIAVSDSESGTVNREGLDIESFSKLVKNGGRIDAFSRGRPASREQALAEPVDVMVMAGTGLLDRNMTGDINARVIVEGALGGIARDTESVLEAKGSVVLPDILACGGASISSHVERIGGNVVDMNDIVLDSMKRMVLKLLEEPGKSLRGAAERLALGRIENAMRKSAEDIKEG